MRVHVLIPAHNEAERLPAAIRSLLLQTRVPDQVTVVSDRSTDGTVAIARAWGRRVDVYETSGNRHRKAGALNQALAAIPMDPDTMVLVMDADSQVAPEWIEAALAMFASDPEIGAVGGVFLGDGEGTSLLARLEEMEYRRYSRELARDGAKARVLTGTSTMVRRSMFERIAEARADGTLPASGVQGREYYHASALTEDFELTLAVKHLGFRCVSPKACRVYTETMGTLPMLWRQRTRWQRGAVQALGMYGVTRVTAGYIVKQVETGIGLVALMALWAFTAWSVARFGYDPQPFWLMLGTVFMAERVVTVWRGGWRERGIAASFVPDLVFDVLISAVYVWVMVQVVTKQGMSWGIATADEGV